MTLPPHCMGDKGQRYEIRATDWPEDGETPVAWTNDFTRAGEIMKSVRRHPACTDAKIIDRQFSPGVDDAA